jgi:O-antigen/teichoic acid export membrane protein
MRILCAGLAALAIMVLVGLYPLLVHRVFHGRPSLWWALVASVLGFASLAMIRGVFAGRRQLGHYAACLSVDGLVRMVPTAIFAGLGVTSVLPYGLALGLGSAAAFIALLPWYHPGEPGPATGWRLLISATGWLVAAWGLSLVLANLAPVVVTALLPQAPAQAGVFAFAFVIARVPVFVLISLQAILLPALTRAAASQDQRQLRRGVRSALLLVAVLGVGGLVLTAPVCRWLIEVLFAGTATVSMLVLTALAAGSVLAMLVQVLQPALIAGTDHHVVAGSWFAGAVVFACCFALPVNPVTAATIAQVAGYGATAGLMGAALRIRH